MSPQLSREPYTRFSLVYNTHRARRVYTYKSQKKLGTAHTHKAHGHTRCLGGLFSFNILWLMTGWTETEMSTGLMRARAAVYHLCPIIYIKYIIYYIYAATRESLVVFSDYKGNKSRWPHEHREQIIIRRRNV